MIQGANLNVLSVLVRSACLVVAALPCLVGCQFGKEEVVFVTNTSIGVDFDAQTPKASIGYSRFEGVLEPQFEQGQTLPVLSSLNAQVSLLTLGAGHSFATGTPAVVFGESFSSSKPYFTTDITARDRLRPGGDLLLKGPTATADKVENLRADWIVTKTKPEDRRRVIFTTSTKLALDVEFESGAGGAPTSLNVGYKRKEWAYAPLVTAKIDGTGYKFVALPALLATADAGTQVGKGDAKVRVSQTFATGAAATWLSSHPAIRKVLGTLLVDRDAASFKQDVEAYQTNKDRQAELYDLIKLRYDKLPNDEAKKAAFDQGVKLNVMSSDVGDVKEADKVKKFPEYLEKRLGDAEHLAGMESLYEFIQSKILS